MGLLLDDLDDHEGFADRRLPDGRLTGGVSTHATRAVTAYVAACGCGWHANHHWPPTEDGEEAAVNQWRAEHGQPLLERQATRHREELARVLSWLGDHPGQLDDPTTVARIARAVDRAAALLEAIQHDLERQAAAREADGAR